MELCKGTIHLRSKRQMLVGYSDFRAFIRDTIAERIKRNKRYSLRAFARDIEVPAPRLSDIIAGRRKMSANMALKIARKMKLDQFDTEYFCLLVQAADGRTDQLRHQAQKHLKLFQRNADPEVGTHLMTAGNWGWQHIAILELLKCRPKQRITNTKWIADCLGIGSDDVTAAIQELSRCNLIKNGVRGFALVKGENLTTTMDVPNPVLSQINREMLQRATLLLDDNDVASRDYSSYTAAITLNLLPKAKQLINKFRAEMAQLLECNEGEAVYTLSVQFFRQDSP